MTEPNVNQVIVAGNGTVYVGPTSATAPSTNDPTDTLTGFTELGYVTTDGVTWTDSKDITDINAWQSFYALRKIVTGKTSTFAFGLMEYSPASVILAFGGGTVTGTSDGYRFVPAAAGTIDERSLVIDYQDGTTNCRIYVPKGIVTGEVATNFRRTEAAVLPITFAATPGSGDDPYWFITDSPSWSDYTL